MCSQPRRSTGTLSRRPRPPSSAMLPFQLPPAMRLPSAHDCPRDLFCVPPKVETLLQEGDKRESCSASCAGSAGTLADAPTPAPCCHGPVPPGPPRPILGRISARPAGLSALAFSRWLGRPLLPGRASRPAQAPSPRPLPAPASSRPLPPGPPPPGCAGTSASPRSSLPTGRAGIGSPAPKALQVVGQLQPPWHSACPAPFAGTSGRSSPGRAGVLRLQLRGRHRLVVDHLQDVSSGVAAANGGRPVSSSYRIAPRA